MSEQTYDVDQLIVSSERIGEMQAQLNEMQANVTRIREDQIKLLEGIAKFFAMAEQMKGNPLFAALMPQKAPPQRGK